MPQRFKIYDAAYPHFITSTIVHWIPVFCRDDYFRVLVDSLAYCAKSKGVHIHGYVLMPNHFHAVLSQQDGNLTGTIRDIKTYTSKIIAKKLLEDKRMLWLNAMQRAGGSSSNVSVWQSHYHPEQVHTASFLKQKIEYMHNNPVRAGFVVDQCDWKYSSAGFYLKDLGSEVPLVPIDL